MGQPKKGLISTVLVLSVLTVKILVVLYIFFIQKITLTLTEKINNDFLSPTFSKPTIFINYIQNEQAIKICRIITWNNKILLRYIYS